MISAHQPETAAARLTCPTYHDQLHPWCIVRLLPNLQRSLIARFRRRNEAEAHLRALRRIQPTFTCVIIFDPSVVTPETALH